MIHLLGCSSRRTWWVAGLASVVLLAGGCSGSACLWLVQVEPERINPGLPLVARTDLPQAFFWANERKELCLAMSQGVESGRATLDLSLVLEDLPAGQGKRYRADRRTLRAVIRQRGTAKRYASYRGIVSVWLEEDGSDVLEGRFRIWANEQEYKLWMDFWAGNREVLLLGEFRAVRDQQRGQAVLSRTEVEELKRGPPVGRPRPVTGPPLATQPAG